MDRKGDDIADGLGLKEHLDLTVTSLEVGAAKPDPAIFRVALARAGADPHEAIHVGDQPSSDVEGALSAGIGPVLLDRDGIHRGYTVCPRIETLAELPAVVERVGNRC
jgi:putative hydrolase of the HAD superfamily